MGIDHGATLIYGYKTRKFKTYDHIPDELTDKAYGDYPDGREVAEKLVQKHEELALTHTSHQPELIGIEVKHIYRTGTEKIQEINQEKLEKKLKPIKKDIKKTIETENEKPQLYLQSKMLG